MNAPLKLIPGTMQTPTELPADSDTGSRVFTALFMDGLARTNHVVRVLHELGLTITSVAYEVPGPVIRIAPDPAISLAPLLARLGPRRFRPVEAGTEISADLDGVTVSWRQAGPPHSNRG